MKSKWTLEAVQNERPSGEGVPQGKRRVMAKVRGHALMWGTFENVGLGDFFLECLPYMSVVRGTLACHRATYVIVQNLNEIGQSASEL